MESLTLRGEQASDRASIHAVHRVAFGRSDEGDLVNRLRTDGAVLASLVAERDGQIVGHILFSEMSIETTDASVPAVALAPMAVLPEFQRKGIGGQLIRYGLDCLRDRGERIVLVLGHQPYYSRFGFSRRRACALASPFPAGAFMALELSATALDGIQGTVRYPKAFGL